MASGWGIGLNIPDGDIDPDSPVTTDLMTRYRDRDVAIALRSNGALKTQTTIELFDQVGPASFQNPVGNKKLVILIIGGGEGGSRSADRFHGEDTTLTIDGITYTARGGQKFPNPTPPDSYPPVYKNIHTVVDYGSGRSGNSSDGANGQKIMLHLDTEGGEQILINIGAGAIGNSGGKADDGVVIIEH